MILALLVMPSLGVVISTGDGSGNTTAPEDDPGFANVGARGGGSAIYLGNRWVLTASHVAAGSVFLSGEEFLNLVEETIRLPNPPHPKLSSNLSDLLLIRLQEEPPLPSLHLGCDSVKFASEVTMVGRGRDRHEEESFWDVQIIPGDNNDIWQQLDNESGADKRGYRTKDTQTTRWGKNLVGQVEMPAESGHGDVLSFQTSFTVILPVDDLAQAVRGDSGGAVFQKDNSVWQLVGMIHAVSIEDSQPEGSSTAILGNGTYVADLYGYRNILREFADFEPEIGDIDGDGEYTAFDIDRLQAAIQLSHTGCHFDFTADGEVTELDFEALLHAAGTLPGDADVNGRVAFVDFLTLSNAFGTEGGWAAGDFDGDGTVGFEDFLILSFNFGQEFEPTTTVGMALVDTAGFAVALDARVSAAAVPEPRSLTLLAVCSIVLFGYLRRNHHTRAL